MSRKSEYDKLAKAVTDRLHAMAPENCESIEEAVRNQNIIAAATGLDPVTPEDFSMCPDCGRPAYRGICYGCE